MVTVLSLLCVRYEEIHQWCIHCVGDSVFIAVCEEIHDEEVIQSVITIPRV